MVHSPQIIQILIPKSEVSYKKITLSGSNIGCYLVPRSSVTEAVEDEGLNNQAVYLLFGEDEEGVNSCYIGKTNLAKKRIIDHDKKLFWNEAIIFIVKDSDIDILENLLIKEAKHAGRLKILNVTTPPEHNKSENSYVLSKVTLEQIIYILNVLGYDLFNKIKKDEQDRNIEVFVKGSKDSGWDASGVFIKGEEKIIVNKGSLARSVEIESFKGHLYFSKRQQLKDEGVLELSADKENYIFTKDYEFNSVSEAGAIIRGASTNGWTAWKNKEGISLDELLRNQG